MADRRQIPHAEFLGLIQAQGVPIEQTKFLCCMCGCEQSPQDFLDAGAASSLEEAKIEVTFSCLGRWTEGKPPRQEPDGERCNWTLGGLLRAHDLEVIMDDGRVIPTFAPAPQQEA